MWVLKNKTIFLAVSALLIIGAVVGIATQGLVFGIEFTGGSVLEVSYDEPQDIAVVQSAVSDAGFDALVQPFGETGVIIRARDLSEEERIALLSSLSIESTNEAGETVLATPEEERFNNIGPSLGQELRAKAYIAIALVSVLIILFIAFVFRKVSKPVSSWLYGVIAIIALIHDILIPVGVFAWGGMEVTSLFVVGLLSILGLSVNDTIVVFDRVRENIRENMKHDEAHRASFKEVVGMSLKQTVTRSINTSLTLIVVLVALYIVGPETTQDLSLVLLIGTVLGTYSSIFVASPLLVTFAAREQEGVKSV